MQGPLRGASCRDLHKSQFITRECTMKSLARTCVVEMHLGLSEQHRTAILCENSQEKCRGPREGRTACAKGNRTWTCQGELTREMPRSRWSTLIKPWPFTLTVKTLQCGHMVWRKNMFRWCCANGFLKSLPFTTTDVVWPTRPSKAFSTFFPWQNELSECR